MDGEMTGTKRRRHSSSADRGGGGSTGGQLSESVTTSSIGSEGTNSKSKKRFVWPDDLHRDFVAAIFDVGLKCASPKTILDMMTNPKDLTPDHIKSHLQKYRLHRERAREEFLSNFGKPFHNLSRDPSGSSLDTMTKGGAGGHHNGEDDAQDGASALRNLAGGGTSGQQDDPFRGQMHLIRDCIQMQAGFQSVLRQALIQQTQLQQQLQAHLQALGFEGSGAGGGRMIAAAAANAGGVASAEALPTYGSRAPTPALPGMGGPPLTAEGKGSSSEKGEAHRHHHHHHHHHQQQQAGQRRAIIAAAAAAGEAGGGKRSAEELMQEEMREHMDMHRQLVLRKNAQVSQYEDGLKLAASSLAAGNFGANAGSRPGGAGAAIHGAGAGGGPVSTMGLVAPGSSGSALTTAITGGVGGTSSLTAAAAAAAGGAGTAAHAGGGGAGAGPHPPLDLDVDLTSFRWNEDDDNLFSFLMDPVG